MVVLCISLNAFAGITFADDMCSVHPANDRYRCNSPTILSEDRVFI